MQTTRQHLELGLICSIIYFVLFLDPLDFWAYFKVGFLWLFLSAAADYDRAVGLAHRHILFHSIALPLLFVVSFFQCNVAIGLWIWSWHLISDIFQKIGKKPVGNYLIHISRPCITYHIDRVYGKVIDEITSRRILSKNQTRFWLFINGIIGIVISIYLEMI